MKILFAVDGSNCSKEAIETALTLKCPVGTELKVVSVVDFPAFMVTVPGAKEREISAAWKLISETVGKLRKTHPDVSIEGVLLEGRTVPELLKLSEEWPAHLILCGSHGRRGVSRFIMGSVSRAMLLNSRCAVRIVRTCQRSDADTPAMNVLVAIDESEHSKHLIDHVMALPWPSGTRFKCLHVVPEFASEVFLEPDSGVATTLAEHYAEEVERHKKWVYSEAGKLNDRFEQAVASGELVIGEPRERILETAQQWPADLIMLGSHGRRGLERLTLGSVSETVAMYAACSVEVSRIPALFKNV
ncbi:MAG: universal stress protein [Cyanobacteria bacterium]|nr:universal stress protein [Cyanobacteriota bacterium]